MKPVRPEGGAVVLVMQLRLSHVFQDYNDHIAEISAKLVAIMDSLFERVLSRVRELPDRHHMLAVCSTVYVPLLFFNQTAAFLEEN